MTTDYFESDTSLHPYVVMAPWRDVMKLVVQGSLSDVQYQSVPHQECFRALLRKRQLLGVGIESRVVAMLDRFTLTRGVSVVLVAARDGERGPFMRDVVIAAVTSSADAAERAARALCTPALICEVVTVAEVDAGPTDWVKWDHGSVELPPWPTAGT